MTSIFSLRFSWSKFAQAAAFGAYVVPVKRTPMMKTPGASAAANVCLSVAESETTAERSPRWAMTYR